MHAKQAFTLAELLIALGILGMIATFTIPKVLQSQQDQKYKSMAKANMAAVQNAFVRHKQEGLLSPATRARDLTPYLNYVRVNTNGQVDHHWGQGAITCDSNNPCLVMHDGSQLQFQGWTDFGGSTTTHLVQFFFDPDGKVTDGTTNGPGKSVNFWVKYTGQLGTRAFIVPGRDGAFSYGNCNCDPPWFGWD